MDVFHIFKIVQMVPNRTTYIMFPVKYLYLQFNSSDTKHTRTERRLVILIEAIESNTCTQILMIGGLSTGLWNNLTRNLQSSFFSFVSVSYSLFFQLGNLSISDDCLFLIYKSLTYFSSQTHFRIFVHQYLRVTSFERSSQRSSLCCTTLLKYCKWSMYFVE